MTVGVQLVLDVFLLNQYLICCIIYLLNIGPVLLNVTFSTGIIGKFPGSFVLADWLYIVENQLKLKKKKSPFYLFQIPS